MIQVGYLCVIHYDEIAWSKRCSSLYLPGKRIFTDEKNTSSTRPIKVPDHVIQLLKKIQNVTLQIAGGIPLTTIAARVEHADVSTTTRIYAHEIRSANEAASTYLDDLLHPMPQRNSYHRIG